MNNQFFNLITSILLIIAAVLILAGSLFQLQHWPYGAWMERIGFLSFFLIGSYEIRRLRKVIRELTNHSAEIR